LVAFKLQKQTKEQRNGLKSFQDNQLLKVY
jgi:hypothetical protein